MRAFCPKCKSPATLSFESDMAIIKCEKCGYLGRSDIESGIVKQG